MMLREKVQQRIAMAPHGTPFLAKDSLDLGPYESVRKVLPWMARDGEILRIVHGVYDRPYYSELLKEYQAPKMDELAHALAHNLNWTIAPSGATAANLLGISTMVLIEAMMSRASHSPSCIATTGASRRCHQKPSW